MSDVTEQIKQRVTAVELIGEYLKLDRAGSNYKALCPFHNEKTPSFMVNPEKNFWYCFGCRRGGDIFSFLMEMEGVEFREALTTLAQKAGVELQPFHSGQKEQRDQKKKVFEILEQATLFFQQQLSLSARGQQAGQYLANRSISQQQVSDFRIGYAPDGWENLLKHLRSKGYQLQDIVASGVLASKAETPGKFYDRFRDRIIFPVINITGQVVGYSARVMPGGDEKNAKYINTPQTMVYDKSQVLFGLYQAKSEIKRKDNVVIVEGNLDVIASHAAGVANVVAVSGTALTPEQVKILRRYSNNFKLCFDMDEAGQSATAKSIQQCLKEGVDVEVVLLGNSVKDVNDLVVSSPSLWPSVSERSIPVMKYFFDAAMKGLDRSDVRTKKQVAQRLLNVIKDIADPIEQSYWLRKLADSLEVDEGVLTKVLEKVRIKEDTTPLSNNRENANRTENKPRKIVLQERFLGLFSLFRNELVSVADQFDQQLLDGQYQEIWMQLVEQTIPKNDQRISQYELQVKFYYDKKEGFIENDIDPLKEWAVILRQLAQLRTKEQLKKLSWDIKKAAQENDEQAMKLLLEEFSRLSKSS